MSDNIIPSYTPHELQQLGKEVATNEPEIVEKYKFTVVKPEPEITHIVYLYPLRTYFCSNQNISLEDLVSRTDLRRQFIAVAIKLFNPEFITGYKNELKDDLAEQLSELLQCDRTWVSQQCKTIKNMLNPPKGNKGRGDRLAETYSHDKTEIENISVAVKVEINNERSIIKRREPGQLTDMFKQEAS